MKEIWKDIKGYEGLYQVSNLGNIKSLNYNHTKKEKILKPLKRKDEYLKIRLYKNKKYKTYFIHRLVAEAFIPNLNNYPIINHIDENRSNNYVKNLEWCTQKQNVQHSINTGTRKLMREYGRVRIVGQYNLNNKLIKIWNALIDIEKELGYNATSIWHCCNNKTKKSYGFIWKYEDRKRGI